MKWNISEVEDAFFHWLYDIGVPPAEGERLSLDGQKHRYNVSGDRRKSQGNAEYCVYMDERPAGWVKDYKNRVEYATWAFFRAGDKAPQWSEEEKREYVQRKEAERAAKERQKEMERARAIAEARKKWEAATEPRPGHPYLKKKGLAGTYGEKQLGRDLLIPVMNARGEVVNVQTIAPDGKKLFVKDAPVAGCFFVLGSASPSQGVRSAPVFLCEGFATGATVHEATGRPVAVCWDCGNLPRAAEHLRRLYPGQLVLAADNDHLTPGNPGMAAAFELAEAFGISFTAPHFEKSEKGTDWNDYAAIHGIERTAEDIYARLEEARKAPELEKHFSRPRWVHEKQNGGPVGTLENLKVLLAHEGIGVSYDEVKKDIRYSLPDAMREERFGPDNRQNAVFAEILSLCERYRFPTVNLDAFLVSIASENRTNPVDMWIRSRGWDGRDRIGELAETLTLAGWFPAEMKALLIRRWLVSAVAACEAPEFKARGVLVLQGAQAIGKTSWFSSLVPPGAGWFLDGVTLDPEDKDSLKRVISHWIIELGELEATFKKADINKLKSYITSAVDVVRLPWARKFSDFPRRTVFCASVNQAEFLVDTTGNSRWWCLPCLSINYQHGLDVQQVWAQARKLYLDGEKWWLTPEEEKRLEKVNQWFFQAGDEVQDALGGGFDWEHYEEAKTYGEWLNATETLRKCGIQNPSKMQVRRAGEVLRQLTGSEPVRSGKSRDRRYLVPQKKGAGLYGS
ncbi:MAG: toprim domain-containing protein [Fretibacterium sp.]|nr:toprim domain-containing protein [Fretibacterium sp.]